MDKRISNFMQQASVRRYTLTDGAEKGIEVIDCDNGKVRFLLNVSKALDIMQLYHEGSNIAFLSKAAFTGREIAFTKRFEGGMLYTVGLDSAGGREGYEVHGSFHNIPAKVLSVKCDEEGVEVVATVTDAELFGKNLVMKRRIFSAIGSDTVTLEDTLVNAGYRAEEYCVLYHVNVGYPMLSSGGKIVADVEEVLPRTPWAAEKQAEMYDITEPLDGQEETCYFLKLKEPEISLVNEEFGKVFTLTYSGETLPEFVEWKSMASGDYALGLEPTTTKLDGGFAYKTLGAGEKVAFTLSFTVKAL